MSNESNVRLPDALLAWGGHGRGSDMVAFAIPLSPTIADHIDAAAPFPVAVETSKHLPAGKAVRMGGTIYISPELYERLKSATDDEQSDILKRVPVLDLGEPLSIGDLSHFVPTIPFPGTT